MLNVNDVNQIYLGCQGENLARTIIIDVKPWLVAYPGGTVTIWHKRNGAEEATATGAVFDSEAGTITWRPTGTDTYVFGEGEAEIRLTVGNVIKKSRKITTDVAKAVTGADGEALNSGWQGYLDAIQRAAGVAITKNGLIQFAVNAAGHLILSYTEDVPIPAEESDETTEEGDIVWIDKDLGKVTPSDEQVQEAANTYLETVITNPDSPPLDRSLSSAVSAAPADMVGDLKTALNLSTDTEVFYFDDGYTIATNGAVGSIVDLVNKNTSSAMGCAVMSCVPGDEFIINGSGSSTPRLWCFIDFENKITRKSAGGATGTNLKLTAETGEAKIILNTRFDNSRGLCCKNIPIPQRIENLRNDCENTFEELEQKELKTREAIDKSTNTEVIYFTDGETITTNGDIGTVVDLETKNISDTMGYAVTDCQSGDKFTINGTGASIARLWCFIDSANKIIERAGGGASEENLILTAPSGAAKLILNAFIQNRGICCKGISVIVKINDLNSMDTEQQYALDKSTETEIIYNFNKGGYIKSNTSPVDVDTITPSANYLCTAIDCEEGEKFTITGKGGNNARLWAFIDEDGVILLNEDVNANVINKVISAPENAVKVIFNISADVTPYMICKNVSMPVRVANLEKTVNQPSVLHKHFDCTGLNISGYYPGLCQDYSMFGQDTLYSDFITAIDSLVSEYSGYITKSDLGVSSDGVNHLYSYDFNPKQHASQYDPKLNKNIPKVIIIAGQHGMEKSNCLSLYYFIRDLIENYTQNPIIDYIRNHVHLIIVPSANPYGFNTLEYKNANGVNLNRNYDSNWQAVEDPDDMYYGGSAPFDQPETQYIRDLVLANLDTFYLCDWHTNGGSNVTSQFAVLWHNIVRISNDPYYDRLAYAANYNVNHITAHFREEYGEGVNDSFLPWGRVTYGLGYGMLKQWAIDQGIVSSTFEGFNGFWFTEQDFTPDVKKANSELIGNWIMAVLNEYGKCD